MQNQSIATLAMDHSIKVFSTNGQILAESLPNEQSAYSFSKVCNYLDFYFGEENVFFLF